MASEAGKGSNQRPTNQEEYSKNYGAIFSKKKEAPVPPKENAKETIPDAFL